MPDRAFFKSCRSQDRNIIKRETLVQMFFYGFFEVSKKNTFFYTVTEHFLWLHLYGPTLPKHKGNHLWNVGLWLGYNVYEEDNLYNIVSNMLEQHCIRILFRQ